MAARVVITCDVCGVERGPSNHWLLSKVELQMGRPAGITICNWNEELAKDDRYKHICGIGDAIKLLSTAAEAWR